MPIRGFRAARGERSAYGVYPDVSIRGAPHDPSGPNHGAFDPALFLFSARVEVMLSSFNSADFVTLNSIA